MHKSEKGDVLNLLSPRERCAACGQASSSQRVCGRPAREREQKNHKYCELSVAHSYVAPRVPALSGEQIDQVREEKGAVLSSQTVFKRLGGLMSGRWQARRKTLVCSSFMGERKLGSDRCEKNAQVREG